MDWLRGVQFGGGTRLSRGRHGRKCSVVIGLEPAIE